jgi:hypothetical protein
MGYILDGPPPELRKAVTMVCEFGCFTFSIRAVGLNIWIIKSRCCCLVDFIFFVNGLSLHDVPISSPEDLAAVERPQRWSKIVDSIDDELVTGIDGVSAVIIPRYRAVALSTLEEYQFELESAVFRIESAARERGGHVYPWEATILAAAP